LSENSVSKEFEGNARIGRIMKNLATVTLKPEDLSSPVAFQMALSRIYESIMKVFESGGPRPSYVAEVRFTDDLGNNVVLAIDLGESPPPFSKDQVKARIVVQIYEEEG
jgi:hypothetical protein